MWEVRVTRVISRKRGKFVLTDLRGYLFRQKKKNIVRSVTEKKVIFIRLCSEGGISQETRMGWSGEVGIGIRLNP